MHVKRHSEAVMEPKYYENDFLPGRGNELEFVRSPFYDLAKKEQMNAESAGKLVDEVALKLNYIEGLEIFLAPPIATKENVAYTRYADFAEDQSKRTLY
jgi:hypothetical protein